MPFQPKTDISQVAVAVQLVSSGLSEIAIGLFALLFPVSEPQIVLRPPHIPLF
jgi:hypothetical protein